MQSRKCFRRGAAAGVGAVLLALSLPACDRGDDPDVQQRTPEEMELPDAPEATPPGEPPPSP